MATILVAEVDLYFRGKLDALLGGRHKLVTAESVDPPDLVIVDISRVDPEEAAETWPDIPILGYTNHTDTAGLRAAQAAGFDRVVVRSALAERAPQIVEELVVVLGNRRPRTGRSSRAGRPARSRSQSAVGVPGLIADGPTNASPPTPPP